MILNLILTFISFYLFFLMQGVKGAPYYVGSAQTLPRGMYSDRNKNIIGKCIYHFLMSVAISFKSFQICFQL